ncbi:MAG: hypothetical protein JWN15_4130 [Firmicutes bacterium]|nr:hypothetical protein [Bacillota bacterium]
MMAMFPGWPGPILSGGRSNILGVGLPAFPTIPGHPGMPGGPMMPGGAGTPGMGPGMGPGAAPTPAAAPSPLAGMAQYGVPIAQTASGQPVIRAGMNGAIMLPPEIPGMPSMPGPPGGFFAGGPQAGGLFQPMPPVAPFYGGNQVRHLEQRQG